MSLGEKVELILSLGNRVLDKKKLTEFEKNLLLSTYKEATGERKKEGCGSCFIEIYLYFNKQKNNKMERKYRLKQGLTVYFKNHVLFNKGKLDNLTDQIAIEMLATSVKNLDKFEIYPKNWQEDVANYDPLKDVKQKRSGIETVKFEEVKQEVKTEKEPDAVKMKREALETKKLSELKDFLAKQFNLNPQSYPKKEWFMLNKEKTIEYIISKS